MTTATPPRFVDADGQSLNVGDRIATSGTAEGPVPTS
jgi:hypothetical protein